MIIRKNNNEAFWLQTLASITSKIRVIFYLIKQSNVRLKSTKSRQSLLVKLVQNSLSMYHQNMTTGKIKIYLDTHLPIEEKLSFTTF